MRDHAPWGFRSGLKHELPALRAAGILDAGTAAKLTARYQLDESGAGLALSAVYVLGALLVGGGILSFVAWHWAALPGLLQLGLVTGLMLGAQLWGHELVRTGKSPRFGQALLLLGTLIFGADLGLVAQLFHVGASWYGGVGAWGLGALAAGLLLGSLPSLVLAAILCFAFLCGLGAEHREYALYLPWAHALVFGGLALLRGSRTLFFLSLVGLSAGLTAAAALVSPHGEVALAVQLSAATLPLALALVAVPGSSFERFAGVARIAGLLSLLPTAFALTFGEAARELAGTGWESTPLGWGLTVGAPLCLAALLVISGGRKRLAQAPGTAAALLVSPALLLCAALDPSGPATAVVANLALVGLGAACLAGSVRGLHRGGFWAGVLLLGLLVISRFFELQTELWMKASAFIACGISVLVLGGVFERRLRRKEAAHAP